MPPPVHVKDAAEAWFQQERAGVASMALGIIEQCLDLSVEYTGHRVQFGQPIAEFQLMRARR